MPANDRLRLHQDQCLLPAKARAGRGEPRRACPEPSTSVVDASALERQAAAAKTGSPREDHDESKRTGQTMRQKPQQAEHGASLTRKSRRNQLRPYLTDLTADRNFGDAQVPTFTL